MHPQPRQPQSPTFRPSVTPSHPEPASAPFPRPSAAAKRTPIEYLKWAFVPRAGKGKDKDKAGHEGKQDVVAWEPGRPWVLEPRGPARDWTDRLKGPEGRHPDGWVGVPPPWCVGRRAGAPPPHHSPPAPLASRPVVEPPPAVCTRMSHIQALTTALRASPPQERPAGGGSDAVRARAGGQGGDGGADAGAAAGRHHRREQPRLPPEGPQLCGGGSLVLLLLRVSLRGFCRPVRVCSCAPPLNAARFPSPAKTQQSREAGLPLPVAHASHSQPRSVQFHPGHDRRGSGGGGAVRAPPQLPTARSLGAFTIPRAPPGDPFQFPPARRDTDTLSNPASARRPSSSASSRGLGLQVWPSAAAVPYWLRESLGLDPPLDVGPMGDLEFPASPSGRPSTGQTYTKHQWGGLKCAKLGLL